MATATRRRTPPVNAEVYKIERGGVRIWTGSAPAYATRRQEWAPSSTGARTPVGEYEVVVPILMGPAEGEPPDPEYPDPPPPPDPVTGDPDNPYDPVTPAEVDDPNPGTYQDALAGRPGYGPAPLVVSGESGGTGSGRYTAGYGTAAVGKMRPFGGPGNFDVAAHLVTAWGVNMTDLDGETFDGLADILPGDTFMILDVADPEDRWIRYTVAGAITPGGEVFVPVVFVDNSGTVDDYPNWSNVTVELTPGAPVYTEEPFRPRFYTVDGRGTWEYDVSQGGLHYSLGADDQGLTDRTGMGRHGAPLEGVLLGGTAGKLQDGDASTYFNGNRARVNTGWDALADFGNPSPRPPDEGFWEVVPPPAGHYQERRWDIQYSEFVGAEGVPYYQWTPTFGANRKLTISGWARRQDRSTGHLLFSHSGFEGPRCWARAGNNDLCLAFTPPVRAALQARLHNGGVWTNVLPDDGSWFHFLIEITEGGGHPVWERAYYGDRTPPVHSAVAHPGGGVYNPNPPWPATAPNAATDPDGFNDYAYQYYSYTNQSGWGGYAGNPGLRATEANLWVNGLPAGTSVIRDTEGNVVGQQSGVMTDFFSINDPAGVLLPADPDDNPWPYWAQEGNDWRRVRPLVRGALMVSGQALPEPTAALYPELFDWGAYDEGWPAGWGSVPAYVGEGEQTPPMRDGQAEIYCAGSLWREGRAASAWKGSIDEFAVHKYEARITPVDVGIRPPSNVWPGATNSQLANTDPPPPGAFAAVAGGEDVAETVQIVPKVGDRVYYRHAGQSFARTVHGVDEREDYGYYRLHSQGAE